MPPDLHSLFLLLREGEASFSILKPQAMNNTGLLKTLNCHLKGQYFSLKDPFSWRKLFTSIYWEYWFLYMLQQFRIHCECKWACTGESLVYQWYLPQTGITFCLSRAKLPEVSIKIDPSLSCLSATMWLWCFFLLLTDRKRIQSRLIVKSCSIRQITEHANLVSFITPLLGCPLLSSTAIYSWIFHGRSLKFQ